jgi:hypothetical protein
VDSVADIVNAWTFASLVTCGYYSTSTSRSPVLILCGSGHELSSSGRAPQSQTTSARIRQLRGGDRPCALVDVPSRVVSSAKFVSVEHRGLSKLAPLWVAVLARATVEVRLTTDVKLRGPERSEGHVSFND